ncbi:MAG: hypothetical protein WBV93_09580 [Anaerobacillus sp.]
MWDWNIDSKDWKYKGCRYMSDLIQQLERIDEQEWKAVILLHERKARFVTLKICLFICVHMGML